MPVRDAERTRTLTTTEAAVLALLEIEGERSAYDLLKLVAKAIGYVWAPARSRLYTLLPRLAADGLAARRTVEQEDRPDKHLYRITPSGSAALHDWLDVPDPGSRDAFYLRLFVGLLADRELLIEHVERFRDDVADELATLRAIEPTNTREGHDAYHWYLLDLGLQQADLRLRWADSVLRDLRARRGR
jgi:PadR family transcriptional regulator, regulatory protein AphA